MAIYDYTSPFAFPCTLEETLSSTIEDGPPPPSVTSGPPPSSSNVDVGVGAGTGQPSKGRKKERSASHKPRPKPKPSKERRSKKRKAEQNEVLPIGDGNPPPPVESSSSVLEAPVPSLDMEAKVSEPAIAWKTEPADEMLADDVPLDDIADLDLYNLDGSPASSIGGAEGNAKPPPVPHSLLDGGHLDSKLNEVNDPGIHPHPQSNILKIMKNNIKVKMVTKEALALMAKAIDLFIRHLVWDAVAKAPRKRGTMQNDDFIKAVNNPDSPLVIVKDYDLGHNVCEAEKRLPVANVFRCMKWPGVMPNGTKVADNAKRTVMWMARWFICVVTSETIDKIVAQGKKVMIKPEDLLISLWDLGFKDYDRPLRLSMLGFALSNDDMLPVSISESCLIDTYRFVDGCLMDEDDFSSSGPFATVDNNVVDDYLTVTKAHRAWRMSVFEAKTANGEIREANSDEKRCPDRQELAWKRQRKSGRFGADPRSADDDVGALS
mmetsp:Transcript_94093/g.269394  ORF Transcript_94093/g.269394 Transcript_94093/m.269394 type:complete len:491 (-) Transcript_94093:336-1808(-)